MHRRTVSLVFSVALTMVFSVAATAAPDRDRPRFSDPRLVRADATLARVILLRPSRDNEVKKDFAVLVYADGHRVITSAPLKGQRGTPRVAGEAVDWSVDLEHGTYTAKRAAPTARDLVREQQMRDKYTAQQGRVQTDDYDTGAGYSYLHAGETHDPVGITLTRTEAEIAWSECGTTVTGLMRLDAFEPSCWANAHSILDTSWANTACFPSSPADTGASLYGQVGGAYINWDFLDNDKPTFAYETVYVGASPGGHGWGWVSQAQSGEASGFLSGHEYAGTVYSRPSSCDRGPTGGGGSGDDPGSGPGDDPGDGSGPGGSGSGQTCVGVYDGVSGDYLGQCCGSTTVEIVECAAGYL
jgi:hypothetical protein